MSFTVYAWWKRPSPNFGGGARHQQQLLEYPDLDSAERHALDLVERRGAHYASIWPEGEQHENLQTTPESD